MKLLGIIATSLVLVLTGAYVLWQFHTGWGLAGGLLCIFLSLCIAFPANIKPGVSTLRENAEDLAPVVKGALGFRDKDGPR